MLRERAGCVGFVAHGAGDGREDEFWVMGGYDGYTTVGGVVPNDVYCRDTVALGLWSGRWREIGDMWVEGERRRLGPMAAISADDGRVTEVFMLDGHNIFRSDNLSRICLNFKDTRTTILSCFSLNFNLCCCLNNACFELLAVNLVSFSTWLLAYCIEAFLVVYMFA
jgi:hypothetical protein